MPMQLQSGTRLATPLAAAVVAWLTVINSCAATAATPAAGAQDSNGGSAPMSTFDLRSSPPRLGVALVVSDLARSRHFYGTVLGLKETAASAQQVRFQSGNVAIKLYPARPDAAKADEAVFDGIGIRLLMLPTFDADGIVQRLAEHGYPKLEMRKGKSAFTVGFLDDPDGNDIELIGLPPAADAADAAAALGRVQVGLTVADIEKTRAFYGNVLGLEELPPSPIRDGRTKYSYRLGNAVIKFWAANPGARTRPGEIGAATGLRYLTLVVADAGAVQGWFTNRGAPIVREMRDTGTVKYFFGADPDGNWIEFAQAVQAAATPAAAPVPARGP
jgi:catechol 2,3-dioxygenase-like lactoylglutathione lyase family enzyme